MATRGKNIAGTKRYKRRKPGMALIFPDNLGPLPEPRYHRTLPMDRQIKKSKHEQLSGVDQPPIVVERVTRMTGIDTMFSDETLDLLYECQEDLGGWHREKMARLADEEAYKRDVLQSELAAEATRSEEEVSRKHAKETAELRMQLKAQREESAAELTRTQSVQDHITATRKKALEQQSGESSAALKRMRVGSLPLEEGLTALHWETVAELRSQADQEKIELRRQCAAEVTRAEADTNKRNSEEAQLLLSQQRSEARREMDDLMRQLQEANARLACAKVTFDDMSGHSDDVARHLEAVKAQQRSDQTTMSNMQRQYGEALGHLSSANGEIARLRESLTAATASAPVVAPVHAESNAGPVIITEDLQPVAVYLGGVDHVGRSLDEILGMSPIQLERVHDFIQVIFPTSEPSKYSVNAPTVSEATLSALNADPALMQTVQQGLVRSLDVMLGFYGLQRRENGSVSLVAPLTADVAWVREGNHNTLRLTRIISSLRLFGGGVLADFLKEFLLTTLTEEHSSAKYWKAA